MKFHSEPVEEHAEVPLGDDGRWDDVVAHFTRRRRPERASSEHGNACYVLSVQRHSAPSEAQLRELMSLVEAQGDRVVGQQTHRLVDPDPRTLLRSGVAARVGEAAVASGADLLVIDAELSPSQTRNLEDATGLPVCDREAVILNVFERHATTRRARIQVEIAHLEYLRPRIRGIGLNMDQQAGGILGGRGPGETASELLARRLDGRLRDLHKHLTRLERSGAAQRKKRIECSRVVLVGYTNAGKTSLMNALTASQLSTRDRAFETLDATSRCLSRHGGDVLLSDTVGFIRRLPERLFASFASTLAEVSEASLLVQVVDSSDAELVQHLETTETILDELDAARIPRIIVFNKTDRRQEPLDDEMLTTLSAGHEHLALCSHDAAAVAGLKRALLAAVRGHHIVREVYVPYELSGVVSTIYARCRVRRSIATPRGTQFLVEGQPHVVRGIERELRRQRR